MFRFLCMRKFEKSFILTAPWRKDSSNDADNRITNQPNKSKELGGLLHEAVKKDDFMTAAMLLQQKAEVKFFEDNMMLLHVAIKNESYRMTQLLLKHGAMVNPSRKTPDSKTPLFLAVEINSIEIALLLLSNGALVKEARTQSCTVFDLVKKSGNEALSELLKVFAKRELNLKDCKVREGSEKIKKAKTEKDKKNDSMLIYVLKKNTLLMAKKYGLRKKAPIPNAK